MDTETRGHIRALYIYIVGGCVHIYTIYIHYDRKVIFNFFVIKMFDFEKKKTATNGKLFSRTYFSKLGVVAMGVFFFFLTIQSLI